jgi:hypothetical protein
LVIEGIASVGELRASWSLDDVARANAWLDLRAEAQEEAMEDARRKAKQDGQGS